MSAEGERTDALYTLVELPGVAAGDTSTVVLPAGMPRDGRIVSLQLVPRAAITANGTNFATVTLQNKGPLGSGSTAMASRTWSATNSVAGTKESGTNNGTAANLEFKQGDILQVVHSTAGTGLALPAIAVVIGWLPRF
jgi:hypothetical protein